MSRAGAAATSESLEPLYETIAQIVIVVLFFSASMWFISSSQHIDTKKIALLEISYFTELFNDATLKIETKEFNVSDLKYGKGEIYIEDTLISEKVLVKKKIRIKDGIIET